MYKINMYYKLNNFKKISLLLSMYIVIFLIVFFMGGTKYSYTHFIYIPLFLSSVLFQIPGGIIGGIIGGLSLAIIPIDTLTMQMQSISNWLTRLIIFVNFGYISGFISKYAHKEHNKIKTSAHFHELTGLPNQFVFKNTIDDLILKNQQFSIVIISIENIFEIYNSIGHSKYDLTLKTIAKLFEKYVKTDKIELFYNDSNFKFLLKNFEYKETDKWVSALNHSIIREPVDIENLSIFLKTNIGVSIFDNNIKSADEIIKNAFIAMDYSSNNFKNFDIYKTDMNKIFDFTTLVSDFNQSLLNDDFHLEYQPKFNLSNKKVLGVEALIRWNHPKLGLIPPLSFIPQLEKTNYINDLTYWILRKVINDIKDWEKNGFNLKVSINLTPKNIQDRDFVDKMLLVIKINMPFTKNIEFELTETDLMTKLDTIKESINDLKKDGIKFAIDDFGTGYSSLAYLKKLPVDYIKIDRIFIKDLNSDNFDKEIVDTTIKLSHALGKVVIAEGVEDIETLELLEQMNCDEIQGYYFSKPIKKSELENFLELGNYK